MFEVKLALISQGSNFFRGFPFPRPGETKRTSAEDFAGHPRAPPDVLCARPRQGPGANRGIGASAMPAALPTPLPPRREKRGRPATPPSPAARPARRAVPGPPQRETRGGPTALRVPQAPGRHPGPFPPLFKAKGKTSASLFACAVIGE